MSPRIAQHRLRCGKRNIDRHNAKADADRMLGLRRAAVHLALIALLLRGFLPAGWMPAAHGDTPLVMCSVIADVSDGHTGDGTLPGKDDPRAHENCAFAASPNAPAPDNAIFLMPVLQDRDDLQDDYTQPVRFSAPGRVPQAPRAPPHSLI